MAVILPQSVQQDIQSSLPIIPNNGNPGGAYNVAAVGQPPQQAAAPDPYAWLQPSAYMEEVSKVINNQDGILDMAIASLLSPGIPEMGGFNIKPAGGGWAAEPVDAGGLPIPADVGGGTYQWALPNVDSQVPQYVPQGIVLPGE